MIEVSEVLEELFKTVGISCTKISFKAITGSVQHTKSTEIKSFINMIYALRDNDYFCIELTDPIVREQDGAPFKINTITILLKKKDSYMEIDNIFTDEEEIFEAESANWFERASNRIRRWGPVIDLLLLMAKIGGALLGSSE